MLALCSRDMESQMEVLSGQESMEFVEWARESHKCVEETQEKRHCQLPETPVLPFFLSRTLVLSENYLERKSALPTPWKLREATWWLQPMRCNQKCPVGRSRRARYNGGKALLAAWSTGNSCGSRQPHGPWGDLEDGCHRLEMAGTWPGPNCAAATEALDCLTPHVF